MRLLKRSIYKAAELTFDQSLDEIAAKTAISDHHPDAREGVTAFREKRAPRGNDRRQARHAIDTAQQAVRHASVPVAAGVLGLQQSCA